MRMRDEAVPHSDMPMITHAVAAGSALQTHGHYEHHTHDSVVTQSSFSNVKVLPLATGVTSRRSRFHLVTPEGPAT